jgi:hypothetical protein
MADPRLSRCEPAKIRYSDGPCQLADAALAQVVQVAIVLAQVEPDRRVEQRAP